VTSSTSGQAKPSDRRTPLSPEAIRRFPLTRTFFSRGYSEDEVERLLAHLARDVEGWITENAELRAEVHRLRDYLFGRRARRGPSPELDFEPNEAAANLLSHAQLEADSIVAQSQAYARQLVEQARTNYEEELQHASEQVQREVEYAHSDYGQPAFNATCEYEQVEARVEAKVSAAIAGIEAQLQAAKDAFAAELSKLATGASVAMDPEPGPSFDAPALSGPPAHAAGQRNGARAASNDDTVWWSR